MLLGHEVSGVVSEVGEGVTHLKPGDRVAVDPHVPCRTCDLCKTGRYNICPKVSFLATPPADGALTRFFVHPADFSFKLAENVNFEEGACVEPLSVGLHSCRRARVGLGHVVLATGAGPIGLCVMLCAKALGAKSVCLTDIDQKRLDFAKSMGATHTLLLKKDESEADAVARLVEMLGDYPDRTIECSGAPSALSFAVNATKLGGALAMVGLNSAALPFPAAEAILKEIDIVGSCRYANTWPTIIDMISMGRINVKPMITHHYKLEETIQAFNFAKSGQGVKVMIDCTRG
ncbi:hypothetical protein FSP39_020171 [Pinctada imbricata]|uniref:Sorbitol dehydrogenase n=1 Tax=Pinctada imbricata TaxID=66713 RepID=A0AA88XN99_PINIB|nr:hypothetical protein FSP39_020171 [Pinctada imbricata]